MNSYLTLQVHCNLADQSSCVRCNSWREGGTPIPVLGSMILDIQDEDDDRRHPLTRATVAVVDTGTTDFSGVKLLTDRCNLTSGVKCNYSVGGELALASLLICTAGIGIDK